MATIKHIGVAAIFAGALATTGSCGGPPEDIIGSDGVVSGELHSAALPARNFYQHNGRVIRFTSSQYALGLADLLRVYGKEIVWETPTGERTLYAQWPIEKRRRLFDIYSRLLGGEANLGIKCPVPSASNTRMSNGRGLIHFTPEEAFDVFVAHVAHALYLEHTKLVPWSLARLSTLEKRELFGSYRYHSRVLTDFPPYFAGQSFMSVPGTTHQSVCDPRVGYRFMTATSSAHYLQKESLVGPTEYQTMVNLTWWAARKMRHHGSQHTSSAFQIQNSTLQARLQPELVPGMIYVVAMPGCHGASKTLYDLARSVNIPLLIGSACAKPNGTGCHGGLVFRAGRAGQRILWRSDLFFIETVPIFPIDPVSKQKLAAHQVPQAWFDTYWQSASELTKWGFQVSPLPPPHVTETGQYRIGKWLGSTTYLQNGGENKLNWVMEWDLRAQLCAWQLMDFAWKGKVWKKTDEATKADLETYVSKIKKSDRGSITTRPVDEYWYHMKACAAAYNGIATVKFLRDTFENTQHGY